MLASLKLKTQGKEYITLNYNHILPENIDVLSVKMVLLWIVLIIGKEKSK